MGATQDADRGQRIAAGQAKDGETSDSWELDLRIGGLPVNADYRLAHPFSIGSPVTGISVKGERGGEQLVRWSSDVLPTMSCGRQLKQEFSAVSIRSDRNFSVQKSVELCWR